MAIELKSKPTRHASGVFLVVISAVVFSTAGIFSKGVSAGSWDVIFWRGWAAAGFTLVWLLARRNLAKEISLFRGPALVATLFGALATAAFIPAFKLTSVANVALIYAAAPFLAAGISWVFLRERPSPPVILASLGAMTGVAIIVGGSLGKGGVVGDFLALFMTLMMAGMMVVYRKWPATTAALPAALSSLVLLPFAGFFGAPLSVAGGEYPVLILFGLVFAIASVTLAEGARRLPAAETALLSALEVAFAPLWAFLILSEEPAIPTILGGAIVFVAIITSQMQSPKDRTT